MRPGRACVAWVGALVLSASAPGPAGAQSLQNRVSSQRDGVVAFSYASREGVLGCAGHGISIDSGEGMHSTYRGRWSRDDACLPGPVVITASLEGGRVTRLGVGVGEPDQGRRAPHAAEAVDLGEVSASEAVDYLLALIGQSPSDVENSAVQAVALADSVEVWDDLLEVATDDAHASSVRKSALFWVGQAAAERATDGLAAVASQPDEDVEVRKAAVFALSQRRAEESVPVLIELARTADDVEVRRSAFFWLAQEEDSRVTDFFRDVLSGGPTP